MILLQILGLNTGIWHNTPDIIRSYAETRLLEPLVQGKTYHLKMFFGSYKDTTNPGTGLNAAPRTDIIANVGAYFSNTLLCDTIDAGPLNVKPQINFTKHQIPFDDSFMYIELSGTYIAQGGEQYLTIANFDSAKDFVYMYITKQAKFDGFTSSVNTNSFIDDVSLVADTTQPMISLDHFSLGNDTTLCVGQKMRLQGDNPYFFHYWWSTGDTSRTITIDTPGTYWCTVDYGCGNYTDTIQVYPPSTPYKLQDTLQLCNRQLPYTFRLPIIQGTHPSVKYHWSNGSSGDTLLISSAGIYYLYRTDFCGVVKDTVRIVVEVPLGGTPAYLPDTTICVGDSVILFGGSGYQHYNWSTGDTTQYLKIKQPGSYAILAYTPCDTFKGTARIQTLGPPPAFSLGADTALCPGAVLVLSAPAGYTYAWQPNGSGSRYINVRDTGYYSCIISNRCGASAAGIAVSRIAPPLLGVGIYGDSTLCKNEILVPATLYNRSAFSKIWNTGDTTNEITVHWPGLYTLTTYNRCGIHKESLYLHGCKGIMAFPNAFSPNGDGRNDVFRPIVQDGSFIEYYVMKIFNRWGQQVFVSFTPDYGWDGGRADLGTYFYFCKFKEKGQSEQFINGEVELMK